MNPQDIKRLELQQFKKLAEDLLNLKKSSDQISLKEYENKVKDPDWLELYEKFESWHKKYPDAPKTKELGLTLLQTAERDDFKDLQPFVKKFLKGSFKKSAEVLKEEIIKFLTEDLADLSTKAKDTLSTWEDTFLFLTENEKVDDLLQNIYKILQNMDKEANSLKNLSAYFLKLLPSIEHDEIK